MVSGVRAACGVALMEYQIEKIYWERVLLRFEVSGGDGCVSPGLYLTEVSSGKRYALRKNGARSFFINITNPGTCRCLPDGVYCILAGPLKASGAREHALNKTQGGICAASGCHVEEAKREFRFNAGRDCSAYSFSARPFRLTVRTEYTPQKHRFARSFRRKSAAVIYRVCRGVSHVSLFGNKKKKVLFMSGQSRTPGANLTAVRDRMTERRLTGPEGGFEILESYRDRSCGRKERLKALLKAARADYIFLDDHEPLFDTLVLDRRTVLTQLWHGGVGFKSSGYSRWGHPGCPPPFSCHRQYTWGVVGSKAVIPIYSEIWGINDSQVLPLGIPRIDRFLDPDHRNRATEKLYNEFPIIRGKKVILFAPTYRGRGKKDAYYPFDRIDFNLLHEALGDDWAVLFRMHPWVRKKVPIPDDMRDRMADAGDVPDINDLFYVSDLLITDYSSDICEFSLMDRPMLFYAFDEEDYGESRGFHRDYETYAPGKVCHTFQELITAVKSGDFNREKVSLYVSEMFDRKDTGTCDRVIDRILLGSDTEHPDTAHQVQTAK